MESLEAENKQMSRKEQEIQDKMIESIKEEHESDLGIRKFECEICEEVFTDKRSLKHQASEYHHDETVQSVISTEQQDVAELYECEEPDCGKSFKTMLKLTLHREVHSDKRPFKCKQNGCTKSFKRKRELATHKRVHNDDAPFKCSHEGCDKAYKWKRLLNDHLRSHSLVKMVCTYPGCNLSFKWRQSLNRHMQSHNFVKPYRCTFENCDASFDRNDHLARHMNIHLDTGISSSSTYSSNRDDGTETLKDNNRLSYDGAREPKERNEISYKLEFEVDNELENKHQCSNCEEAFKTNEFLEHLKLCGKYIKSETM